MIPFWTSFVVRTYGIYNVISYNGPLYQLLHALGLVHGYLHLLFTPIGVGIGIVYTYLPLMILPLYVALERIDPAMLEAASDLGAEPDRVLRRVTLPLAVPGIIAGCILVAIPATGEYVIPQILGGGKTLMFGNVVSDQFLTLGDYPFGAALAVALTVVLMIVLMVLRSRSYKAEAALYVRLRRPRARQPDHGDRDGLPVCADRRRARLLGRQGSAADQLEGVHDAVVLAGVQRSSGAQ